MLSWMPLEGKLWLLEAFFGNRYGVIIFWILYQFEGRQFLTYNPLWDPPAQLSYLGTVTRFMNQNVNSLGRLMAGAISGAVRASRQTVPKKLQINNALSSEPILVPSVN
jgi:hypothetical protein